MKWYVVYKYNENIHAQNNVDRIICKCVMLLPKIKAIIQRQTNVYNGITLYTMRSFFILTIAAPHNDLRSWNLVKYRSNMYNRFTSVVATTNPNIVITIFLKK
jgi:hypothetical protein